jgi:hypothetical protein
LAERGERKRREMSERRRAVDGRIEGRCCAIFLTSRSEAVIAEQVFCLRLLTMWDPCSINYSKVGNLPACDGGPMAACGQ